MNRKQFFNKLAKNWDKSSNINKTIKKIEENILTLLKKYIKKSNIVLDLGCGTGIMLPYLKKLVGKNGKIYALDFSKKMLDKAKEKFGNQFFYVKANAHNMPFENTKFDCVVCFNTFPHFVKKLKVLKEVNRILKKDGYFIIAHSENKEKLNKHHQKFKQPIKKDLLPSDKKLFFWFKKSKFVLEKFIENQKIYFVVVKK